VECLNEKGGTERKRARRACVLSLNEELIRTCNTQIEKATLLRRTEKQLRPGEQKFPCRRLEEY